MAHLFTTLALSKSVGGVPFSMYVATSEIQQSVRCLSYFHCYSGGSDARALHIFLDEIIINLQDFGDSELRKEVYPSILIS